MAEGRRGRHREGLRPGAQPAHAHPGEPRGVTDGSLHLRRQEQPRRGMYTVMTMDP